MADIPLPADTARVYRAAGRQCRNFGLLFDRFVPYGPGWVMEGNQKSEAAKSLVSTVNGWRTDSAYKEMFTSLRARQEAVMKDQQGASFVASPEWRLVIGLGRDSAFETGLTLHRVYGCPYIPGSALKGMTRAWATAMQEDEGIKAADIQKVFGSDNVEKPGAGEVVFYDALPTTPPELELDMMNPHYPDYYQAIANAYPTDWQSPIPVYFITVAAKTQFLISVGARRGETDTVENAAEWLKKALEQMGIGGKTTSGYGYWSF
ncbi:MAG: type III-B CRISPR module RAMP protein Cmr6 [Anaerolineae bacterium]|nr:type III-B CRISPR module RAMP protein Cmr6 [Anaerolineae bacterium]